MVRTRGTQRCHRRGGPHEDPCPTRPARRRAPRRERLRRGGGKRRCRGYHRRRRAVRHPDRLRRRLADRRLHAVRQAPRGPAARPARAVQLRRQLAVGDPADAGRAGRRLRQRERVADEGRDRRRSPGRRSDDLHRERPRDRRPEGQPGPRHRSSGLREPRPHPGRLRAAGAVRRSRSAGLPGGRNRRSARHPGGGRQGRTQQGPARRGRCGAGLRHRCPGGGRRRRGHRVPRGRAGRQQVPDLHARGRPQPRCGPGVRRPRPIRRGAEGTGGRGLPRPVTKPERHRRVRDGGVPLPLLLPAAIGVVFLVLPLLGLVLRAPWSELGARLAAPEVGQALRLSLVSATLATVASLVLGVPIAWVLARSRIRGRSVLRALVTVPLVLPPVVGGVALFLVLGRRGIVGQWLFETTGFTIPFTTLAVVLAETFVAMPFLVISVEGALRAADARFEDAAATLGADRWTTFRRVTLPLVAPGIAAGAVLCWARALGEFGATITFAGNFPGTTQTMPLAVYLALQSDPEAAIVLSLLLLVVSLATLLLLRDRWLGRAGAAA